MTADSVHKIRLKGPWEVIAPGGAPDAETRFQRIVVPVSWREVFGETAGTALFRRRFHTPTNLSHADRVVIRIPPASGEVREFSVNGRPVEALRSRSQPEIRPIDHRSGIQSGKAPGPPEGTLVFDVTHSLQDFNELRLALAFDPAASPDLPGGLWESVFLEVWDSGWSNVEGDEDESNQGARGRPSA